jgi:acetylglutamate kinase
MIEYGVASGGMVAKIEACLLALTKIPVARIIDGRAPHALLDEVEGKGDGTTISW